MSATVVVVALQGAVDAHCDALRDVGIHPVAVRQRSHLEAAGRVDGLVLPGGESTTLSILLQTTGLAGPIGELIREGVPTLGTCAGMILLASNVLDGRADQLTFAAIDLVVRRNGFGRQVESFETTVEVEGLDDGFPAVFIRGPRVESVGAGVEVLARLDDSDRTPVLCREGHVWVSAFHPELTADRRIHHLFAKEIDRVRTLKMGNDQAQEGCRG